MAKQFIVVYRKYDTAGTESYKADKVFVRKNFCGTFSPSLYAIKGDNNICIEVDRVVVIYERIVNENGGPDYKVIYSCKDAAWKTLQRLSNKIEKEDI